ncbi:MAG: DNA polymerase III subunit delta' [Xanthomonadales bacterium]|nr:DNA polymerase III subunit delta' [Gammaproteobacteria bacterium]MBT8052731.1 DNA polymerase III subunit delta' [Gammaproteobacteria bacterium]NND55913.1 DNA polymerase III subunit delta' [Xanthomonadales bacterium]NNK50611.1 DNA polymerase III subunit delta' [Xanthomonadales bacterium]
MTYPWTRAIEEEFAERLREGRLPHAILLSGPHETGKTEAATGFVASILCLEDQYPACGACRSCQLLASGAHPDRHTVTFEPHPRTGDLRKEIVIDQVRKLIASLNLTNTISRRKAALIHPVEAMNRSAANALLKTLEEPPGDTVLILVAHDTGRLPATIRSRCQNLLVRTPDTNNSIDWLCSSVDTDADEAEAALAAAAGSPLKAARMIQDGSLETYRLVVSTLRELRAQQIQPGAAMASLADADPELLWSWISLHAATEVRNTIHRPAIAKSLSQLQSLADRNRKLLPTPVRKDFLLQDWLIQWSRLTA